MTEAWASGDLTAMDSNLMAFDSAHQSAHCSIGGCSASLVEPLKATGIDLGVPAHAVIAASMRGEDVGGQSFASREEQSPTFEALVANVAQQPVDTGIGRA